MDWNDCNASNRCCSSTCMRVSSMNLLLLLLLYSCANMSCSGLQITSAFGQLLLLQVPAYNIRMSSNSMSNPDVIIPASFQDFTQASKSSVRLKAARELNGEVLSSRPSTDLYFVLFALRGTAGSVAAPFKFSNSHKCQCRTMMLMASSTRAAEEYGSSPKKTESRRQLGTNRALLTNVGLL